MKAKRASRAILYVVLTIRALYTLSPLAFLLINSFKTQPEIVSAPLALPSSWDFGHLTGAAEQINFWRALAITALVTLTSVALLVVVSSLSAWMMVRNHTRFSNVLLLMFTAAMLVPFQAVMYPLISLMENLQLKNLLGLIIMYGGFGLSLSVFLYHGFIKSVPRSVEEAAVIDGCNILQLFFRVVFPLLKSTTVTVIILNAMWIWNDFLLPYLTLDIKKYKTISIIIQYMKGSYGRVDMGAIMACLIMAVIPVIVFYLCCQKYIIKGVAAGAVKG